MGNDSVMRTTTEIEGLVEKRNDCLKAIANKLALLAKDKMKSGETLGSNSISNMIKELSYEEQVIILTMAMSAVVNSESSNKKSNKGNYDYNDLFKGRGF